MKILPLLLLTPIVLLAQKKSAPDKYAKEVQTLTASKPLKEAFTIIDNLEPQTRRDHIELTEIPAPPFKEGVRAKRFKELMSEAGPDNKAWIDSLGNVLVLRKGTKGTKTIVIDAHLDTVFPEGTDVKVKTKGDTLFAPGISDDTRGLVAILTILRALEKANIKTEHNILFVASLGEEGLGDLRGVKYLFDKQRHTIDSWISVDGTDIGEIVNGALGSVRYKATIKGPGGHSWGAFGIGNPHHAMAKAVNYFSDAAALFTASGIKTSFNIGRTGGGTSVNSIPFESWAEVDMRSESPQQLKKIDSIFKASMTKGLNEYNKSIHKGPALTILFEQLGFRPSGTTNEKSDIVQRGMAAASFFGAKPFTLTVSTNSNIPISKGIPAITIGAGGKSSNEHSLSEWWINDHGTDGIKFGLMVILLEAVISR